MLAVFAIILNGDGDKSGVKNYGKTFVVFEMNLIIKLSDFFIIASIDHWRREGIRGLWAKITLKHASLVPICAKVRNHRTIGGGLLYLFTPLPDFWNLRY